MDRLGLNVNKREYLICYLTSFSQILVVCFTGHLPKGRNVGIPSICLKSGSCIEGNFPFQVIPTSQACSIIKLHKSCNLIPLMQISKRAEIWSDRCPNNNNTASKRGLELILGLIQSSQWGVSVAYKEDPSSLDYRACHRLQVPKQ